MPTNPGLSVVLVTTLSVALAMPGASQQGAVEEEDLPLDEATEAEVWEDVRLQFETAEEVFRSPEQDRSVELFTQLVETLSSLPVATLEEAARREDLLARCLSYRGRARFNLGDSSNARSDLEELIRLQPQYEMDRTRVSSKLLDLFDSMKGRMVGFVEVLAIPGDTEISVDGEPFDTGIGPVAVLDGTYTVRGDRPGFGSASEEVEVRAGKTRTVELTLERTSAVVWIRTWPKGATVLVDGVERGLADQPVPSDWVPSGAAALKPREDLGQLVLGDLAIGGHEIEVRRRGYRPSAGTVDLEELRDYPLQPILLDLEAGTVVLDGLPSEAIVTANGQRVEPARGSDGVPQLMLPPNDYWISVRQGRVGVFERRVTVLDQRTSRLEVELRPGLVLVGILGGDRVGAEKLKKTLERELERLGNWAFLDRSAEGPQALSAVGIDTEPLRSMGARGQIEGVDWKAVQRVSDEQAPGAVYLLAVLADDLVASHADLWIWPAAPGSSRPDLRTVPVEEAGNLRELANAFAPTLQKPRLVLGMLVIDSQAAAGPVVASVTAGGPAAVAGLRVGDEITAFGGTPVLTAAQIQNLLRQQSAAGAVELEVQTAGTTRNVRVTPKQVPQVVDLNDGNLIFAALSAEIASELAREKTNVPRWVLELNRAAVLLQSGAYEDAVRTLRPITAPAGDPLGQATVDYLLGVALLHSDARYADRARDAFARAAADEGARLLHEEGPWIAPRARARLAGLGGQ